MQQTTDTAAAAAAPEATFGARLAVARRAAGMTQEQLAQGMGAEGRDLGKGAISSWEQNASQPTAKQLTLLCQRLVVSANYLLGLQSDISPAYHEHRRLQSTRCGLGALKN